jgi:cancer susceptibility candidate protein 1
MAPGSDAAGGVQGSRGVAFSDALNKRPEYVPAPSVATVQDVRVAMQSAFGEVHHDILALLGAASAPQAAPSGAEGEAAGAAPESSPSESAELRRRLRASADAVEMARNTNALTTEALAQLLYGLKVFSFG